MSEVQNPFFNSCVCGNRIPLDADTMGESTTCPVCHRKFKISGSRTAVEAIERDAKTKPGTAKPFEKAEWKVGDT